MNVYPLKCRVRNEGTVTRVDVYDDIGEGGWFSEGLTAKDFAARLSGIKGALDVHINSCGGDCFDGVAITNAIRDHKGATTTIVDGVAASIASVIFQAGAKRVVKPNSMVMVHDAFGACIGNAAEMTAFAGTLDKVSDNIASVYADRSGKDAGFWRGEMRQEKWYTAQEAIDAGLADSMGDGEAELPASLDVAAFTSLPGRIAAQLRSLPVAAAGASGDDGDGDDDAPASAPPCKTCSGKGRLPHPVTGKPGRVCPGCGGSGEAPAPDDDGQDDGDGEDYAEDALRETIRAVVREELAAAAGQPGTHGDHQRFDPDGDGDCDACPEGDTDHDYWSAGGDQLKSVPGKPMPASDRALTGEEIRAIFREEIAGLRNADGDVDNSPWDAAKAWHAGAESDDPAAFYAGICAGKKAGDKSTQDAWALPYKYAPSSPPNAAGVRNALARLPQTEGLTNEAEAKATLQAAMKKVNPDWEPEDSGETDLSGIDLTQLGSQLSEALKGAIA